MRYALVKVSTGIVENVVEIGDETNLPEGARSKAPDGYIHVPAESAGIGDTWTGEAFIQAHPPMGAKV